MESFTDHERLILCPYNKAHEIRVSRMHFHLTRCRKQYPESANKPCDFNSTHMVPEPELQYHHEYCPDRKKIELQIYEEEGTNIDKYPIPNIDVPTEESWDNLNVQSYDPKKYCESKPVLRQTKVESAAKRRNFRQEEIRRINELTAESKRQENSQPVRANRELPNKATGTILLENEPDTVKAIQQKIKIPQIPMIPRQQLPRE